MTLLCFNSLLPSLSSSSSNFLSPPLPFAASPVHSFRHQAMSLNGVHLRFPSAFKGRRKALVIVKAASDMDGTGLGSTEEEKALPEDQLPFESKKQRKMEQRMKMKLAKKTGVRRRRLLRKCNMRKKGRWPPSKMNKLKNV